jgi:hypothetical protein
MLAAMPDHPKYRAFLSYSHADSRAAARPHARLEGFRIDKDLAGRDTPRRERHAVAGLPRAGPS